jgi:hypothetical protein
MTPWLQNRGSDGSPTRCVNGRSVLANCGVDIAAIWSARACLGMGSLCGYTECSTCLVLCSFGRTVGQPARVDSAFSHPHYRWLQRPHLAAPQTKPRSWCVAYRSTWPRRLLSWWRRRITGRARSGYCKVCTLSRSHALADRGAPPGRPRATSEPRKHPPASAFHSPPRWSPRRQTRINGYNSSALHSASRIDVFEKEAMLLGEC